MDTKEYKALEMIAYEAFIRRAAKIDLPFMLKGSYVTRQYFSNPTDRIPGDLDWVCLETIGDEETARKKFNEWMTLVTELELNDGVKYRSFKENEFWRRIDYAMSDDFPTVNTDLKCWVDGKVLEFGLDLSFNLPVEQPPVALTYQPIRGEAFVVSNTVPISLQVAWKIHQTLVRPRFKDMFDLIYLVQHPDFDRNALHESFRALINECQADEVDFTKLKYFLTYEIIRLFPANAIEMNWKYWRFGNKINLYSNDLLSYDKVEYITDTYVPEELMVFLSQFREAMEKKGWTIDLIKNVEIPPAKEKGKKSGSSDDFKFDEQKEIAPGNEKKRFWDIIKKMFEKE